MRFHRRDLPCPVGGAHVDVIDVPEPLAEHAVAAQAAVLQRVLVAETREAQLRVLLPIDVGDQLRQPAKSRLALAQRAHRRGLQCRETHDAPQAALVHLALGDEVVGAVLERLRGQLGILVRRHDDDDALASGAQRAQRIEPGGIRQVQIEQHEIVVARGEPLARRCERAHPVELGYSGITRERRERRVCIGRHGAQVGAHELAERFVVFDEQDAREVLFPPHARRIAIPPPVHDNEAHCTLASLQRLTKRAIPARCLVRAGSKSLQCRAAASTRHGRRARARDSGAATLAAAEGETVGQRRTCAPRRS